jgi:hypothetical protein
MRRVAEGVEAYAGVNAYRFGLAKYVLQEDRRRPRGQTGTARTNCLKRALLRLQH